MQRSPSDILLGLLVFAFSLPLIAQTNKIEFWNTQRKGANYFNTVHTRDWFVSSKEARLQFVRMVPNKWKSQQRDFLLGNADSFSTVDEADFQELRRVLAQADSMNIKIVLSTLSLPGARWRQQNGGQFDTRLWTDSQYIQQARIFWKQLAEYVRNHPSVVGYDILNEPIPELAARYPGHDKEQIKTWYNRVQNTSADLNRFNAQIAKAIREADAVTPIIVECGEWAAPHAIEYLKPLADDRVIYSFHMYEPFHYTNWRENSGKIRYPNDDPGKNLNVNVLDSILRPVSLWQKRHRIPANRILVGEFGCNRMVPGAEDYLSDLINIFNRNNWHWAFYSFREDEWDGMDYELGAKPLGWKYWKEVEQGKTPARKRTVNPIWNVFRKELK